MSKIEMLSIETEALSYHRLGKSNREIARELQLRRIDYNLKKNEESGTFLNEKRSETENRYTNR